MDRLDAVKALDHTGTTQYIVAMTVSVGEELEMTGFEAVATDMRNKHTTEQDHS